jgi:4-hydroxy-tetrahydrodipicolinate synthase
MTLPRLHGIVPPLPTPLLADGSVDAPGVEHLVEFQVSAGVHGLWVLGTTARFDMIPDSDQRIVAERSIEANDGRVPVVLNVSDQGTRRTLERARLFDDLPCDYYAALPPWYLPLTRREILDYFKSLADSLTRPLVIYNAPWVCNQLTLDELRQLAEHPRIVGCKDVGPSLNATQAWTREERVQQDFAYLAGNDNIDQATTLGADGFVSSLSNAYPELAVAIWDAARAGNRAVAGQLQAQWLRLAYAASLAPMLACLEVMCRHRGILDRMLPAPLRTVDDALARRILDLVDSAGELPQAHPSEGVGEVLRTGGDTRDENG